MLKIIQCMLQQYLSWAPPSVQAGFWIGRGTRDWIASLCLIMKNAKAFWKKFYFCFIDCAKAFDCVNHNELWKLLKEIGISDHLTCLLYVGHEATVRTRHGKTDWFKIGKGISKVCILLPCLASMQNASCDMPCWMNHKLESRFLGQISKDDVTLMAESEEKLKILLMWVKEVSAKISLKLT